MIVLHQAAILAHHIFARQCDAVVARPEPRDRMGIGIFGAGAAPSAEVSCARPLAGKCV